MDKYYDAALTRYLSQLADPEKRPPPLALDY